MRIKSKVSIFFHLPKEIIPTAKHKAAVGICNYSDFYLLKTMYGSRCDRI